MKLIATLFRMRRALLLSLISFLCITGFLSICIGIGWYIHLKESQAWLADSFFIIGITELLLGISLMLLIGMKKLFGAISDTPSISLRCFGSACMFQAFLLFLLIMHHPNIERDAETQATLLEFQTLTFIGLVVSFVIMANFTWTDILSKKQQLKNADDSNQKSP